ncbi:MAG: hypothetical protein JWO46_3536, partial [Nocardioidaceae bacterium]|nr:hypothetical protein [Nocardioidaceae bacterium]
LPFVSRLREDGHLWWLWTCLAGFGLGMAGWDYCRRRRRARLAAIDAGHHELARDIAEHPAPSYVGRRRTVPTTTETVPQAPTPPPIPEPVAEAAPAPKPAPASRPPGPGNRPPFRAGPKKG